MKISIVVAALAATIVSVVCVTSLNGQENSESERLQDKDEFESKPDVPVAEMPVVGEWEWLSDFWYSNRFRITEALHDARIRYRKGQMDAARDEIKQAVVWLKLAVQTAGKKQKAGLQTAVANLGDIERQIAKGEQIKVVTLRTAFANANLAIAKHHFSKANKAAEKNDMLNASRRLVAAADHLRNAANSASLAPSPIVATFIDDYSPYGSVEPGLDVEPGDLKIDLEKLSKSIDELSEKMKLKAK